MNQDLHQISNSTSTEVTTKAEEREETEETTKQEAVRLGVIIWNAAHFGEKKTGSKGKDFIPGKA